MLTRNLGYIHITPASPSSRRPEIYTLLSEAWKGRTVDIDHKINTNSFLFTELNGKLIGFINYIYDGQFIRIIYIFISLRHQDKSFGSALLNEFIATVNKPYDSKGIIAHAPTNNTAAVELFKKCKFKQQGQRIPSPNPLDEDYVMILPFKTEPSQRPIP